MLANAAAPFAQPTARLSITTQCALLRNAGKNAYRRRVQRAFLSYSAGSTEASYHVPRPTAERRRLCRSSRTYVPLQSRAAGPIPTGPGRRCRCAGDLGDESGFGCFQRGRWLSSSSSDGSKGGGPATTATTSTTPPQDVSPSDLNLAMAAAAEPDSESGSSDEPSASPDGSTPNAQPDHLSDIPGATTGSGKKLAIVFTCKVCSTRSAKKFSEQAYNHGVVLVRCPGCQNLHLIADRLGFFEDKEGGGWDIQKALAERGEEVVAVTDDNVLELTMKDVLGGERAAEVVERAGGKEGGGEKGGSGRE